MRALLTPEVAPMTGVPGVTLDGGHRKPSYLRCRVMGSWERGASR